MFNKLSFYLILIIFVTLSFQKNLLSDELLIEQLSKYIEDLNKFKCNFIQLNPDGTISEGNMIYSDNKIKISYLKPSAITFIAREKKAMYFHEDLLELHYFNPNKTAFSLFTSMFNLTEMPKNSYSINSKNDVINLNFDEIGVDQIVEFSIFFQNNPIELKKIKWTGESGESIFSIFNIDKNIEIHKKTFSMVNPILNN